MNISKRKVTILPPKFHDFSTTEASAKNELNSTTIWEIGVPEKNSLPWSIVLSYLLSSKESNLDEYLKKLKGNDEEVYEIKQKKNLSSKPLDTDVIKKQLKSLNPFKNRHTFFHQAQEMIEVMRIFDLRLNRYGNKLKKKNYRCEWNDDFKIDAASLFLECEIEVHVLEEATYKNIVTYPTSSPCKFKDKIILFQYKNQQHGSRLGAINIFRFGMSVHQANPRKLDALGHFLEKAKVSSDFITVIKEFMKNTKNHGKDFLSALFKNECGGVLETIYRSPYIALKISEAGFETNPLVPSSEKLSTFSFSLLFSKDCKQLSILYDYASNCRCLFDHSVRRVNDNVLEALKKIKDLLEIDASELLNEEYAKKIDFTEGKLHMLRQYIAYVEYQIETASDLNNLKNKFESSSRTKVETFKFRKSVIESVLKQYKNFFYYDLQNLSISVQDQFSNYLNFSEYYKNADSFGFISFFDNFYQLRLQVGLKQENVFSNIEWKIFVVILFNNYFPESDYLGLDQMKYQKANILRFIPLLHRSVLHTEIPRFLDMLETSTDSELLQKSLKENSSTNDSNALPMVIDVLIKIRLEVHIQAALEVSLHNNDNKSILVIERALQVIGESIKPPSANNGIISYFLRSCLSPSLQTFLISIRNNLSHRLNNSIYGRLTTERNLNIFRHLQKEIAEIKRQFEVVFFTQFLRIEESAMGNCFKEIERELEEDFKKAFDDEYIMYVSKRIEIYEKHHDKCVQLLFNTLSDLQEQIERSKQYMLIDQLKAINYLLLFILRQIPSMNILKKLNTAIGLFISSSENKEVELFKKDLCSLLSKWVRVLQSHNIIGQPPLSSPAIESFIFFLKSDLFSSDEESQIEAALLSAYDEATDANKKLEDLFSHNTNDPKELEVCLEKIFIPPDKIINLKNFFSDKSNKQVLKLLKDMRFPKKLLDTDIKEIFQSEKGTSYYFKMLLIKITYQKYLHSPIYTTINLSDHIVEKLEIYLTKTVLLLVARIQSLKSILIDEDEEIKETWIWGKSREIKYHLKFLMRQRYMRDITVRASLDMAFFDCVNILDNNSLSDLYKKSTDLFSGIDLRNVLSHRTNIPETIGGILDEDDFPSTMIEKMLELIDDLEAINSTLDLFPKVGILEENKFVTWVKDTKETKYMKQIKAIRECERWNKYLFLFPFIK